MLGYFEPIQLDFLIFVGKGLKLDILSDDVSLWEEIKKNKDGLSEKIKGVIKKNVESEKYKIEDVVDVGVGITADIMHIIFPELGSKLFLSFLLDKEEKQELIEKILKEYLNHTIIKGSFTRDDFEKIPSDDELLGLIRV